MKKRISKYMLLSLFTAVALSLLVSTSLAGTLGTGILYVYTDTWGGTEAPKDVHGTYHVTIGNTYYIRIWDITEFTTDTLLTIKIGWKDVTNASRTDFFYDVPVKETSGKRYVDIAWTVPNDAKICTTATVHYKGQDPLTPDYLARGQISNIGHMHIIFETPLGTIATTLALFTCLGVFALTKKRQ